MISGGDRAEGRNLYLPAASSRAPAPRAGTFRCFCLAAMLAAGAPYASAAKAEEPRIVLKRGDSTIVLEPYAANILRVSLSLLKDQATAAPGYGFIATPSAQGWTHQPSDSGDIYRSSRLVVKVAQDRPGQPLPTQLDIAKFFSGSAPPAHITVSMPEGATLLELTGWSMSVPNHKDGNAAIVNDKRPADAPFYQVGATFASPDDEHYYGLGQNQEGYLDLRGHAIQCWHNYNAAGGPSIGVPFVLTNRGYGMIWDNPSKTTFQPGFNEQTRWTSEVGDRVSFFVIAGATTDEILIPATVSSPGPRPCCRKRLMASFNASSATPRRMRCSASPGATASGISRLMCWWLTGSITPRWARWTWTLENGPTRLP